MPKGHGEKMTRKQEAAVAALLSEPTVEAAAARAGVSYRSLKRWLATDQEFLAAYRDARREVVEQAIALTQRASAAAVACLFQNMKCGTPAAEISAAKEILARAIGGVELIDLLQRVEALERRRTGQ